MLEIRRVYKIWSTELFLTVIERCYLGEGQSWWHQRQEDNSRGIWSDSRTHTTTWPWKLYILQEEGGRGAFCRFADLRYKSQIHIIHTTNVSLHLNSSKTTLQKYPRIYKCKAFYKIHCVPMFALWVGERIWRFSFLIAIHKYWKNISSNSPVCCSPFPPP